MKTTTKLLTLLAIIILIGSCKRNSTESIDNKTGEIVSIDINPEEEFNTINTIIKNKQADSISENDYTYWTNDDKIIKLNVFKGDGENFSMNEDYYFYDNKVFASKIKKMVIPDAIDYEALVFFKNSEIIKEDYWMRGEKTTKSALESELKMFGSSIENDIILDDVTKKSRGLLTLPDLSKRLGLIDKASSKSNKKSYSEIRGLVIAGSKENMKKQLGEPDDHLSAYDFFQKYRDFKVEGVAGVNSILNTSVIIYNNIEINNKPIAIIYHHNDGITSVKYLSEVNDIFDLRP
jgi:hypothetical protein